jgi:ADP-dependent NAD(P)H-hydrate dehydratase
MNEMQVIDAPPPPPARPADGHKGTFGTVIVVGGSPTMIGAPALTASAALRTGCGLVKLMTRPEVLPWCLTIEPSATGAPVSYLDDEADVERYLAQGQERKVLAIGPGMGTGARQRLAVQMLLAQPFAAVIDADGLNNLAAIEERPLPRQHALVMTPHPGEFKRLAAAADIDLDPVDPSQRTAAAAALALRHHAVVVLKGRRTVVTDGHRVYVNTTGNPALATAGSGDVLTGAIASFMAQGMEAMSAAVLGVYVHGSAADLWAAHRGAVGLAARDLAALMPDALELHRKKAAHA